MYAISLGTLDLMGEGYGVTAFDASQPGRIRLRVDVDSASTRTTVDLQRVIRTQLNNATRAAQPASSQSWVTLSVQASVDSEVVEFPVKSGTLQPPTLVGPGTEFEMGWLPGVFIELETLPYGLGEAIEYGPFTVTGDDPAFHINGVPGDEPALAEFRVTDNSTGVAVNRLRWAARSLPEMTAGDFDAVLPFGGDNEDTDTFTGFYESIAASSSWQTIGSVTKDATVYNGGVFDVWARVRDETASLGVPEITGTSTGENISPIQVASASETDITSLTVTLSNPPQSDRLLVILARWANNVTMNTPSGFTAGPAVGTTNRSALFHRVTDGSESGNVDVSFSGSASNVRLRLQEWRGIATSSPFDVSATNTASGTSASTGTTATTAQTNSLAFALFSVTAQVVPTTPTGWTNTASGSRFKFAWRILATTGTQSATSTVDSSTSWSNLIAVFKGASTTAASVPANGYSVRVVAVDSSGGLSAPSNAATVTLTATGAIHVEWSAASGPVDQYRVYWRPDGDDYRYVETGSTATSYTITSNTGDATEDPPSDTTISPASFRIRIGPESGTTYDLVSGPLYAAIANSEWEPLNAGRTYLSPSETPLIASNPGWKIELQGKADRSVTLDADALVLMPADEQQMDVRYTAGNLDTPRVWVVGTTPDLRSYAFLLDGSGDEAGRLLPVGTARLGPGDTTVVLIPTVENGVWNVEDVSLSVMVHVRPCYSWLAGGL